MGAAPGVSRNNPAPNTKMVARRMAATTARMGWRQRVKCRLHYSAVGKFLYSQKTEFLEQPPIRRCLWPDKKSPDALMLGVKLGGWYYHRAGGLECVVDVLTVAGSPGCGLSTGTDQVGASHRAAEAWGARE